MFELHVRTLLAVLVVATAACGGRSGNDEPPPSVVFIRQLQRPIQPDCFANADPAGASIDRASLDVALASQYEATFLVGNTSFAASASAMPAGSNKIFQARSATVRVLQGDGAELGTFHPVATGTIDPGGRDPGYGLVAMEVIPPTLAVSLHVSLAALVHLRLEVHVRIAGVTLDGVALETPEYVFDLDACRGCSVVFPREASDPTLGPAGELNCLASPSSITFPSSTACFPGQDGTTDCRTCQSFPECTPCIRDSTCPSGTHCLPSNQCG